MAAKHIWTSNWVTQYPYAGWNIQHIWIFEQNIFGGWWGYESHCLLCVPEPTHVKMFCNLNVNFHIFCIERILKLIYIAFMFTQPIINWVKICLGGGKLFLWGFECINCNLISSLSRWLYSFWVHPHQLVYKCHQFLQYFIL